MKALLLLTIFMFSLRTFAHEDHGAEACQQNQLQNGTVAAETLKNDTGKIIAILTPAEFYKKFKDTQGLTVKGSRSIDDLSLIKASSTVAMMISKRPDIKNRLISNKADIVIIAKSENYCDIPEAQSLRQERTFDGRDFCSICGGGGVQGRPITTVCEDNLLRTEKDPYHGTEDILTHEFAHTMHILGMSDGDKKKITDFYKSAKDHQIFEMNEEGKPTYMMANEQEFFACLSAAWFGVHNPKSPSVSQELVDRQSIKDKLPEMYEFMKSIYPE